MLVPNASGKVMGKCKDDMKSVHVVEVLPSEFGGKVVGRWIAKLRLTPSEIRLADVRQRLVKAIERVWMSDGR